MNDAFAELVNEDTSQNKNCEWCAESHLGIGKKTSYGAIIVYRIGKEEDGWFATLSPKTGGDPAHDCTLQLMSTKHLTHFCQLGANEKRAANYGIAFAKLSAALTQLMAMESPQFQVTSANKEDAVSVATYGKATNWKEKKEHLHVKLFPFRNAIGQPYTVDSTFEKKHIHKDKDGEFVKMQPVKKVLIDKERLELLAKKLMKCMSETE